jgi:hypothetical protein
MPVDDKGREYDEAWDTTTGLPDDFDGTVVSSKFGTVEDYKDADGNLQPLFIATIKPAEGDPFDVSFSLGKGWEIADNGMAVTREDGKRKFVASSMYGMLNTRAKGLWPDIKYRTPPDRIGAYNGTSWHWKREKIEYGGRLESREHLMPTTFIGVQETSGGGGGAGADSTLDDLRMLALQYDDHKSFLQAFLKDKDLQQRAKAAGLTKGVLSNRDDGIWATARRELG